MSGTSLGLNSTQNTEIWQREEYLTRERICLIKMELNKIYRNRIDRKMAEERLLLLDSEPNLF